MKILITNDDGIYGEGLEILTRFAMKLGEVTVVAPKFEQSGKSHAIEIHKAFEVKKVDYIEGVEAYTVDSSPADCVRYAILGLKKKFDLVFSGINKGVNLGGDIMYSGTVGAAIEASRHGVNAIACSTEPDSFETAARMLDTVYSYFTEHRLLDQCSVYNVNIPLSVKGIRITRQGGPYFDDFYTMTDDHMFLPNGYCCYELAHDYNVDTDATMNGYISITPLTVEQTDRQVFEKLKALND